ncbi:uncharacterized protein F5147DRAFT_694785 [Suillus discolor]|uniref:Secreted protein n=1 Tax=Suillus discolor TaxID=1912936 RepID=A0A9P7F620_9AGAM|nr:uncharacterized protein F5147DRAFT_694785 [Suillus discolor]KAG2108384.1 hypothetical protein F5147DRAFT_694785 [Suillus discolor]
MPLAWCAHLVQIVTYAALSARQPVPIAPIFIYASFPNNSLLGRPKLRLLRCFDSPCPPQLSGNRSRLHAACHRPYCTDVRAETRTTATLIAARK